MDDKPIECIDVFCGGGALTRGLLEAGIEVVAGLDTDPWARYPFEANNGAEFLPWDVRRVGGADLERFFSRGAIRMLAGCAPCQPFSTYRQGVDARRHRAWGLLDEFTRIVRELEPDLVTMENVTGLIRQEPFRRFVAALAELGYCIDERVLEAADYGVPQFRQRLVVVASRLGPVALPGPRGAWATVRESIQDLPPLEAGESDPDDPLHSAARLSPLNLERIRHSVPGGTWRDWPTWLRAPCHAKESGRSYPSVYGRMEWETPAPTITTLSHNYGSGRFGHPEQDRAISAREAALLQSFPRDYEFGPPGENVPMRIAGRLIGNAVPPRLARAVGEAIKADVFASGELGFSASAAAAR